MDNRIILCGNIETASLILSGDIRIGNSDQETYLGPYLVIPKTVDQTLNTANKLMREDVTVTEIPYAETSNVYGTTVTIAS